MSRQKRNSLQAAKKRRRCSTRHSFVGSSYARRLHVETLEDRRMLAVFSVGNLNDAGTGSLREAIDLANATVGSDSISISVSGTIDLASQLPTIADDLYIYGPGASLLTLDAGNGADNTFGTEDGYRIFNIDDGLPGGTYFDQIRVSISGLTLTGGDTSFGDLFGNGGAIRNLERLTVRKSVITGNSASDFSAGGGIYSTVDTDIFESTVSENSAFVGGGLFNANAGAFNGVASLGIHESTISGNTATVAGGIYNSSYTFFHNSTLSGNSAEYGAGGIENRGVDSAVIHSSTISNNTAGGEGGGIRNFGQITIDNTIVALNTAGAPGPDISNSLSGTVSGSFNLIGDGTGQTGLLNGVGSNKVGTSSSPIDALLGPLTDNGGLTETHALHVGSPAIDAGDPTANTLSHGDQRQTLFVRLYDDPTAPDAGVDIGAFERQTLVLEVNTVADVVDTHFGFGNFSLREAILFANANPIADTITFSSVFDATQTIVLDSQLPTVSDDLTITGPGVNLLTLDAGNGDDDIFGTGDGYRLLDIDDGNPMNKIDVKMSGLKLTGGDSPEFAQGGAVRSFENLTVDNTAFEGNSTIDKGGAIFSKTGILTVNSSSISGNSAGFDGGGIHTGYGTANITRTTISNNSALGFGGGIFNGNTLEINSSTLSDNTSSRGGGLANGNWVHILKSTITNNVASDRGGGVYSFGSEGALLLEHTIVANNSADIVSPDVDANFPPQSVSGSFNLIGDGTGQTALVNGVDGNQVGTNSSPIDPLLGPLVDNGGPTLAHALLAGSPAIDSGDPSFSSPPFSDQRGLPFVRVFDDPTALGVGIDIGALEHQILKLEVDTIVDENDGDYSAGDFSLREAIAVANSVPGANSITFSTLFNTPQTIALSSQLPTIAAELIIMGPGADLLTLDAGNGIDGTFATGDGYRILDINDGNYLNLIDVAISGLTLTGGDTKKGLNNTDGESGGAIRSSENLTIIETTITGNATGSGGSSYEFEGGNGGGGGGIYSSQGSLTIIRSTISGNLTGDGGEGEYTGNPYTLGLVENGGSGGGVFFYSTNGNLTISGSTISGNTTGTSGSHGRDPYGGGIYANGTAVINNSTISKNSMSPYGRGGGIYLEYYSTLTLDHTVVADNSNGFVGSDIYMPSFSVISGSFNLIGDGTGQTVIVDGVDGNLVGTVSSPIDPLLGPLTNNGGPTPTHALLLGSPAIDAGDLAISLPPSSDQRGAPFVRIFDDPSAVGTGIDIGATERQTLILIVDTTIDENDGDFFVGDFSLREAIAVANSAPGADTITFAPGLDGGTIELDLSLGDLDITSVITVDASTLGVGISSGITIDAGNGADGIFATEDGIRIFDIDDGTIDEIHITLRGLVLTGGDVAEGDGGAIRSHEDLTIEYSTISGNSAIRGGGVASGFYASGTLEVSYSTISDNISVTEGGGILAVGSTTITESTISGNSTSTRGGGIATFGSISLASSTISGNSVEDFFGGGIYSDGTTSITSSTISGNSAGGTGGGIWARDSTTITSSTISGNSAGLGAGIYLNGGATIIEHSTITGNSGDGIASYGSSEYPTTDLTSVAYTIISGNISDDVKIAGQNNPFFSLGYNLIGGGDALVLGAFAGDETNIISSFPLLGPLTFNGGSTWTHALLFGSPAIDAGGPDDLSFPDYDQRGFTFDRVVGGQIDIGAVETGVDSADFDNDGDVDGADFLAWQRGFGTQTPIASHADGDADNDQDVDGADLGIWQGQFGSNTSPVVASSVGSEQASTFVAEQTITPVAVSGQSDSSSNLIDAALAMEWLGTSTDEEEGSVFVGDQVAVQESASISSYLPLLPSDLVVDDAFDRFEFYGHDSKSHKEDDLGRDPTSLDQLTDAIFASLAI